MIVTVNKLVTRANNFYPIVIKSGKASTITDMNTKHQLSRDTKSYRDEHKYVLI